MLEERVQKQHRQGTAIDSSQCTQRVLAIVFPRSVERLLQLMENHNEIKREEEEKRQKPTENITEQFINEHISLKRNKKACC
jgi:hypothetical protein